ncbi:Methylmalonyl-CoA mutase [bioreactor metagenome]|uniref:Methylmalonyl-CoA mutase n=2 Tax=root TaxID=1 RepID=A0A645H5G4_9ZZZZ
MQALAAVLGGTQSLHTNSRDEALSLPTEDSVTIALRTQQIIGEESGVCETIDPLAGSYYVESLTDQIEKEAMKIIENIDSMGGSPKAIENGYIQEVIMKSAYKYQQKIENKEKIIVGVNKYISQEQEIKGLLKVDEVAEKTQISKLNKFKQSRDNKKTTAALEKLRTACNTNDNMMPYIIEAVESYATLGEICKVMRDEFGEYVQGDVF